MEISHAADEDVQLSVNVLKTKFEYVYFEADEGGYVGYFKDFPQHVTQGETIGELEGMLLDVYECLNLSKQF